MYEVGMIFSADEDYTNKARWANENGFIIRPAGDGLYRFAMVPEQTREEQTAQRVTELKKYLQETDWYCARYVDSGAEIPQEVKVKRAAARAEINELEASYE